MLNCPLTGPREKLYDFRLQSHARLPRSRANNRSARYALRLVFEAFVIGRLRPSQVQVVLISIPVASLVRRSWAAPIKHIIRSFAHTLF